MTTEDFKRKLTAILSADVVGYSRLMGDDEESTVRTLNKYKELIFNLVEKNNGRVIDSPGDNVLAEFASVVDTVKCAVQVQKDLIVQNESLTSNRKMEFRIGINIGDVIHDGDRIYGDGVNVAARIESLADPGGICLSRTAYDQIRKKLDIDYEYLGEHKVKNIDDPVRVYRVLMDSINNVVIKEKRLNEPELFEKKIFPLSEESSIAVLPFMDLSPEKDQEYFADGIAEELLNSLIRISELEVRGRTSSFYFKDRKDDLRTISKMLNVEYILEGSVRKAGEKVRITVQLINTRKDAHIWSKTYDRTMGDIFVIQEDIAQSVADALQITLKVGELGRAAGMTRNIDAYDAYLIGLSLRLQPGRENISQAIERLEQAVALDPDFAIGWNDLAKVYNMAIIWIPERGEEFISKRIAALSRVVELIPETDVALRIAASRNGDRVEVERLYKKALSVAPMDYETNSEYGDFLINVGRPSEAVEYFQRLVRMEPFDSITHLSLGVSYELCGKIDTAAIAMKKARDLSDQPAVINASLLILAQEANNRELIDEYVPLVANSELHGNIPNIRDIDRVMHALLDTPEKAGAELKLFLTDPAYSMPTFRVAIALWASYFGEHELALHVFEELNESANVAFALWRPLHKGMRRLPGFKNLIQKMGLVDYWHKSGKWGDFCHPVGDDDFICD